MSDSAFHPFFLIVRFPVAYTTFSRLWNGVKSRSWLSSCRASIMRRILAALVVALLFSLEGQAVKTKTRMKMMVLGVTSAPIARISGDTRKATSTRSVFHSNNNRKEGQRMEKTRKPNLDFAEMGIPIGSTLVSVENKKAKATVLGDRKVKFRGMEMYLSPSYQNRIEPRSACSAKPRIGHSTGGYSAIFTARRMEGSVQWSSVSPWGWGLGRPSVHATGGPFGSPCI